MELSANDVRTITLALVLIVTLALLLLPKHVFSRTSHALTPSTQGASPRELLLEACRRNNTNLLSELLAQLKTPERIAQLLNTATDGVGNYCLHVAAAHGSCTLPCAGSEERGFATDV